MTENPSRKANSPIFLPKKGKPLPETAFLIPVKTLAATFIEANRLEVTSCRQIINFEVRELVDSSGRKICMVTDFIGAPAAAVIMENLTSRSVNRIVFLGYAGSIKDGLGIGDILIADGAISEEGISRLYIEDDSSIPPPSISPSEFETCIFGASKSESFDVKISQGKLWSTDAPYKETMEKVKRYAKAGASAVDMEVSAVLSVCSVLGIESACSVVISDELHSSEWRHGFGTEVLERAGTALSVGAKMLISG